MKPLRPHLPYIVLLAIFCGAFIWGLEVGILGHDYFYFFPKLLDGKWHFLRQGLRPFYYTAHMCGGFPEYANPQSMYYSLQQLLVLFLDLWLATKMTILTSMVIAYVGWYRFGRDLIRLNLHWAHVLALVVTAHGFHFLHQIAGHIVFHGMPLLGWMLWLALDRRHHTLKGWIAKGAWFGLLSAYVFYSGGYMVGVMGLFALVALLPYELLLHAGALKSRIVILSKSAIVCISGTLLLNASKLVAVFSFVQYFPRAVPFERLWEDTSILLFLWRTFFVLPQNDDLYWEFGMPNNGAFHEWSFLISPVILIGLTCGIYLLWKKKNAMIQRPIWSLLIFIFSIFQLCFFAQWARGFGVLTTPFEDLPIFEGLHVNMRWLYAYSFLLIAVGTWCLQRCCNRFGAWAAYVAGVITIVSFVGGYYGQLHGNTLPRTLPYDVILAALNEHEGYMEYDVTQAFDMRGQGHSGFVPLIFGGNHIYCHEPMLLGSSKLPNTVIAAPVTDIRDGAFNLYNPACMVYPEENDCQPGDRIRLDDQKNFEAFVTGQQTTWTVSPLQRFANWVSVLSLITFLTFLTYRTYKTYSK